MRYYPPSVMTQLQENTRFMPRDLVYITAKNRSNGNPERLGFWNGDDTITVSVRSGSTGLPETREYHGWGSLVSISSIPLVSDLTIRSVGLKLSNLDGAVMQAFRQYDSRLAPIEIHRAFFNPETNLLVGEPQPRFVGWINSAPIETPPVDGSGSIDVSAVTETRALTMVNPTKRSDATQSLRSGDRFRKYSDVAGLWEFFWGEHHGTVTNDPNNPRPNDPGLNL